MPKLQALKALLAFIKARPDFDANTVTKADEADFNSLVRDADMAAVYPLTVAVIEAAIAMEEARCAGMAAAMAKVHQIREEGVKPVTDASKAYKHK